MYIMKMRAGEGGGEEDVYHVINQYIFSLMVVIVSNSRSKN